VPVAAFDLTAATVDPQRGLFDALNVEIGRQATQRADVTITPKDDCPDAVASFGPDF
jgi:hypothetical protein